MQSVLSIVIISRRAQRYKAEKERNMEILRTEDLKKYYGEGETCIKALDGVNSVSYTHLTLPTIRLV